MPKRKGSKKKAQGEPKSNKKVAVLEDDEEIDEDMAFDAKDEEKYGHLFQGKEGEEDGPGEEEEGVPQQLSDMLDEVEPPATKQATKKDKLKTKTKPPPPESEEEDLNEDDEDEDEDDEGDEDEGEEGEEAHNALLKTLGSLDNQKVSKKASTKTVRTRGGTEMLEETEFAATGDNGLNMQDLMGSLSNLKNSDLKKLKSRLVKLSSEKKSQPVEVPLDAVHQNAVERKVTYETVKQEISHWAPTVAKNRAAKTLELPLNEQATETVSSATLQTHFKPSNNLENDLQNILEQYGYTESAMRKREQHQLEQRELTTQEVQEKQQHLAQLKSLLFYHEIKQKRLKKIKSKQYRKLKKKREEGKKLSPEELARLNPGALQDQQMTQEADRIKERMTQRHKNTSKWAMKTLQLMKNQRLTGNVKQSRGAIEQQLEQHQKLSRKPDTEGKHEESSDDEDDGSESDGESDARFKAQIAALKTDEPDTKKAKGLGGLKFMQKGLERKRAETEKLLEEALLDESEQPKEDVIPETKSRKKFTAVAAVQAPSRLEDGRIEMLSNGFQSSKVGFSKGFTIGMDRPVDVSLKISEPSSDLLFEVEEFSDHETERKKTIEFKTPVVPALPKSILKRKTPAETKVTEKEESEVKNPWQVAERAAKPQAVKLDATNLQLISATMNSSKFNLLGETEASIGGQEKLVKEAFSITGEAEQMFMKEKEELVTADLPKFEDHAIPGWGNWGDSKSKPKPLSKMKLKIKAAIEKKAAEEAAGRQDAKLSHVIISQKTDKKSLKYMVPQLPYPFTSIEQFDKAQRTPVGTEWNTMNTFQDTIKPSVITKPGTIIEPIARSHKSVKRKQASRVAA